MTGENGLDEETSEIVAETLDALRAATARAVFLLRMVERDQLDRVGLRAELRVIIGHLEDATAGFHRIRPDDGNGELDPRVVLIIDDDPNFARALRRRLHAIGIEAYHEIDPHEAVKTFGVLRPATVFVDIVMPDRDGTLVAAEIKGVAPEATVVLITGFLTAENAYGGGLGGADRIVEKGSMEPLLRIARGELPVERVVHAKDFPTEAEVKRRHAQLAVERFGTHAEAARALGIDTRTLERRLEYDHDD